MQSLLFHCIGRGGEVKPIRWTGSMGCRWDKKLGCLVIWWKEQKVIRCYPLAIIADAMSYKNCSLHGFSVYSCAGGLWRTEEELKTDSANMIFPSLAKVGNAAVTTKISNLLPAKLTAKALRRGGVGQTQFHADTTQHDVVFRSGHHINDNTSKYSRPGAMASKAGAMALAGYSNIRAPTYYPKVPRGMLAKQGQYIDLLFHRSFDCFKVGGELVPFMEAMLGSLVQYYNAMVSDKLNMYNCPVIHQLVHTVMEVEEVEGAAACGLLRTWSDEVQALFTADNAVAIGFANSSDDIKEFIKTSSSCTTELMKQVRLLTLEVSNLKNQLTAVADNLMGVAVKVDEVTSPRKPSPQK
jgi:hypothetical protein